MHYKYNVNLSFFMEVNWFKYITVVFISLIFFKKVSLGQNILTQTSFSSTYNDEQIGQNNYTYRINYLFFFKFRCLFLNLIILLNLEPSKGSNMCIF